MKNPIEDITRVSALLHEALGTSRVKVIFRQGGRDRICIAVLATQYRVYLGRGRTSREALLEALKLATTYEN